MPYCNNCGTEYAIGIKKCVNCDANLPKVVSELEGSSQYKNGYSNPRTKRLLAGLIDIAIVVAITAFMLLSKKLVLAILLKRSIAFFIPVLYLLLKDSFEGKSIGKMIMNIIVYNEEEKKAGGIMDSIIRNWYLAIPLIGPTIFGIIIGIQIFIGRHKRLGEKNAKTIVITDSDYQQFKK